MRSLMFMLAAGALCLLSACGNKGPLYRPHPVAPAAATTAMTPVAPASMTPPASASSAASDD
ncbi:LPS translocon maturation chaperone LptM [Oleiagrimonas soli]|uniref:Putative small lipoprotein YifL n=1 Tax=Oleiagrimonas soli TaxID=1543381 RepID=A0A099CYX1_9GAMM|nr:lipoprotein [Oleiagrimonas soli]KGI79178.1 hypothetical protein LF63_0100605 [Oleiagrimonas soli]MBB6184774.1 putative small lipoprotein YifL [Oleiagrimonas soli]